jgi:type I restriction enzyme M protein
MARGARKNGNGKRLATPQSVDAVVKSICDIMRRSNCAGALQYVPELTWILFLRILDERESREHEQAEAVGAEFSPSLDSPYRGATGRHPMGRSGRLSRAARWVRSSASSTASCCRTYAG